MEILVSLVFIGVVWFIVRLCLKSIDTKTKSTIPTTNNNWRDPAVYLAAYYNYFIVYEANPDDDASNAKAFFFAFNEFYKDLLVGYENLSNREVAILARYFKLLMSKGLGDAIEYYSRTNITKGSADKAVLNMDVHASDIGLLSSMYFLERDDYGLEELIYSMKIIQFSEVVAGLYRHNAIYIIKDFLNMPRAKSEIERIMTETAKARSGSKS